ncbi:MAG: ComEA family DNA-binding protein [Culicoidibacterales bacterium]
MWFRNFFQRNKLIFSSYVLNKGSLIAVALVCSFILINHTLQLFTIISNNTAALINIDNPPGQDQSGEVKITKGSQVNLNSATKKELMTLPSIGEKKADDIIKKRESAKFEAIEDLLEVKGIGATTFEKLRNEITI